MHGSRDMGHGGERWALLVLLAPLLLTVASDYPLGKDATGGRRDHMKVPLVGFGTARLKGGHNTILNFFSLGGRLVDTALTYRAGKAISAVGEASRRGPRREEQFIVSKIPEDAMGYNKTARVVLRMLEALQLRYIDLVLVHRPWSRGTPPLADDLITREMRLGTWDALVEARRVGRVRFIGVANYGTVYLNELAEAGKLPPAVNELEFHPWIGTRQRELVEDCRARGIHIVAYNSLGGKAAHSDGVAMQMLKGIAARYGKTPSQVLLRFAVDQNISVIPSSNSMTHIKENLHIRDFQLTATEREVIGRQPRPPTWGTFDFNDAHRVNQGSLACDTENSLMKRHAEALASMRRGIPWRTTRADDLPRAAKAADIKDGDGGKGALAIRTFTLDVHGWPAAGLCDSGGSIRSIGKVIQRSKQPFVVLPRYLTRQYGTLINETRDELLGRHKEIHRSQHSEGRPRSDNHCHSVDDGTVPDGGDMRCHNCARWNHLCRILMQDVTFRAIGQGYYDSIYSRIGKKVKPPTAASAMVMANAFSGNGANSGGNWHQDVKCKMTDFTRAEVCEEQMKCMVYLDDTFEDNGPFTMLLDYDRVELAKFSKISSLIRGNPPEDNRPHRFDTRDIAHMTNSLGGNGSAFAVEIHAPAGTVICFDSGNVHHGKNLQRGHRTALTLYMSSPRRTLLPGSARDWLGESLAEK